MAEDKTYSGIFSVDGSAFPNPGDYGFGVHGYIYETATYNKNNDRPTTHYTTDTGYVVREDMSRSDSKEVKPTHYLDMIGGYSNIGTNNMGELLAIVEVLRYFNTSDVNVNDIIIQSDSKYAIGACNAMLAGSKKWNVPDKPNLDILRNMSAVVDASNERGAKVTLVKVKGHSGDLGNHLADRLALLGRVNSSKGIYGIKYNFRAGKYWKLKDDKHPFINVNHLFFTNDTRIENSYIIMDYPTDIELGKKTNESLYGVVVMKEPIPLVDNVVNAFNNNMRSLGILSTIKVSNLTNQYHIVNRDAFGDDVYMFNSRSNELNVMDNLQLANHIRPAGLATQMYTKTLNLRSILDSYLKNEPTTVRQFHDVTDVFFGKDAKDKPVCILNNGARIVDVNITVNKKQHKLPMLLGIDLIPRNNIKRLEKLNPKVTIVSDIVGGKVIEYYTVIECDDGVAIYCNFYSNKIFI